MNSATAAVIIYLLIIVAICYAMYVSGSAWWIMILLFINVRIDNNKKKE